MTGWVKDSVCLCVKETEEGDGDGELRSDAEFRRSLRAGRGGKVLKKERVHTRRHLGHGLSGNTEKRRKDRDLTERPICFSSTPPVFMTGQAGQIIYTDIVQQELRGQATSWMRKVVLL